MTHYKLHIVKGLQCTVQYTVFHCGSVTKDVRVHSDIVQFGTRFKVPVYTEADFSTGFRQF